MVHWDVNNEQLHGEFYENKTGDLDVMTKLFKEVKKYDENALLFLNDFAIVRSSSYTRASLIFLKLLPLPRRICFSSVCFLIAH